MASSFTSATLEDFRISGLLLHGFDAVDEAEGRGVERGDVGGYVHPFLRGVSGDFAGLLRGKEAAVGDVYLVVGAHIHGLFGMEHLLYQLAAAIHLDGERHVLQVGGVEGAVLRGVVEHVHLQCGAVDGHAEELEIPG